MTARCRRWLAPALALLSGSLLLVANPGSAVAEVTRSPGQTAPKPPPAVDERGSPLLRDQLERVGRDFVTARNAVRTSKSKQLLHGLEVQKAQARLAELQPQIGELAAQSYRTGKLNGAAVLLESRSRDSFLARAVALNELNVLNDQKLEKLQQALNEVKTTKAILDREVKNEEAQLRRMEAKKNEAEQALKLVGGTKLTGGFVSATSPIAKQAPRGRDGNWAPEGCTEDDPTTSGCLTPRTKHMYNEVKRAGFDRFVGCFRTGDIFEHPKGRACDWSLQDRGFSPAHNDDTRLYGNNLCAFLVRNADRLGILYVIWYEQIWFPATGWTSYSGDSPHTDHVHVSML